MEGAQMSAQRCVEVHGGMQRCAEVHRGCVEGCMKVCRGMHTCAWRCTKVHRGCVEMARGMQRCVEGVQRYMEMG